MTQQLNGTAVNISGDQPPAAPPQTQPTSNAPPAVTQPNPQVTPDNNARVDAVWQQMNKGISKEKLNSILKKAPTNVKGTSSKPSTKPSSSSWMTVLGLGQKKSSPIQPVPTLKPVDKQNDGSAEALKAAAAALSAVRDTANMAAVAGRGKVEVREVRDFAGESIEVKKLVDANMAETSEKEKGGAAPSAVDAILEQIKKKPKLSVLDKTKKDWGEFKEENRLDEELETYKKSGNQYLDKVSFLERADYREYERERDARLAVQAKRKADMREDD
uniref:craniofacial development protein 1 n=1 Tax=Erigeron canadensis TaxID=72917 RepID=UPI001CB9AA9C|nr:craniofacial development protein 1 [Erigeron canadensis]